MRGSKAVALLAALALAGCGSADDLRARWLVLPSPPHTLTNTGPGSPEVTEIDLLNTSFALSDIEFMEPFDRGVFPERTFAAGLTPDGGYQLDFENGSAALELGSEAVRDGTATLEISFGPEDIYYSDMNDDGFQDAMIVFDQTVTHTDSSLEDSSGMGVLLISYDGGVGSTYYFNPGPVTSISAIDGGFSMTARKDGLSDTIEVGMPEGVPVRIDSEGGSVQCVDDIDEIRLAQEQEPFERDSIHPYPGVGEVAGYEEFALFEVPIDPLETNSLISSGYAQVVFLADGGDINRWTDYRCGWVALDDL